MFTWLNSQQSLKVTSCDKRVWTAQWVWNRHTVNLSRRPQLCSWRHGWGCLTCRPSVQWGWISAPGLVFISACTAVCSAPSCLLTVCSLFMTETKYSPHSKPDENSVHSSPKYVSICVSLVHRKVSWFTLKEITKSRCIFEKPSGPRIQGS